jgi:hypothetical protein
MRNNYSLTKDLANTEYSQYQDKLTDYYNQLNYASTNADNAYTRGSDNWYNSYSLGNTAQSDAYNKAAAIASATGDYSSMAQFGWTQSQIDAANAKANPVTSYSSGGGGSSYSDDSSDNTPTTESTDDNSIEQQAVNYMMNNSNVNVYDRGVDEYMVENGISGDNTDLFRAYLLQLGASTRAIPNPNPYANY